MRTFLVGAEEKLINALRRLAFAARTSGGTAGRDQELCDACEEAEKLLGYYGPERKHWHHMGLVEPVTEAQRKIAAAIRKSK